MSSLTLDTDIVIEILRGNQRVINKLKSLDRDALVYITGLTVYELYKGVLLIRNEKLERDVEDFIESVEVLQPDPYIEKKAGKIYADLRKRGELINDADILIAATAVINDSVLVTNNIEHFKRIKELKLENWLQ